MPDPINYLAGIQPLNLADQFTSGLQAGASYRAMQQQQEDRQLAMQAAQAKQAAQEQYARDAQTALADGSARSFEALHLKYPAYRESINDSFKLIQADEQKNIVSNGLKVYSALRTGNIDAAKAEIQRQIDAKTNAGQDATDEKQALEAIDKDPKAAAGFIGYRLTAVADKDTLKALNEFDANQRSEALQPSALAKSEADAAKAGTEAKYAEKNALVELAQKGAQLGLTKAQTNKAIVETRKVGTEIAAANLELAAAKKNGGISPAKAFEQEEKLRKEYETRSKGYNDARTQFSAIKASAADGSGAGDIALVTAFNKMLDPGSVVRETEFANSRDTAGVLTKLSNAAQKLQRGSFLDPAQRAEFVKLAGEYYKAAEGKEKYDRATIGTVVKNYGLNESNVFGPARENLNPAPPPKPNIPPEDGVANAGVIDFGALR